MSAIGLYFFVGAFVGVVDAATQPIRRYPSTRKEKTLAFAFCLIAWPALIKI